MATKKTSRKIKTTRQTKPAAVDHNHIGKCFVAFGLIITALLFGFFYLLGNKKSYMEKQEILAFRSLAESYIYSQFDIEGERATSVVDYGMTKDRDLYVDFVIETLENKVPTAYQKARLHFQCREEDSLKLRKDGCAKALWYDDEVHYTSNEYQTKYRAYIEKMEETTDRVNAAETEEKKAAIQAEFDEFTKSYKDFNWNAYEN